MQKRGQKDWESQKKRFSVCCEIVSLKNVIGQREKGNRRRNLESQERCQEIRRRNRKLKLKERKFRGPDCTRTQYYHPQSTVTVEASKNYSTTRASVSDMPAPRVIIARDRIPAAPEGMTIEAMAPPKPREVTESWAHPHLEERLPEVQSGLHLREHSRETQPPITPIEGRGTS